MKSVTSITHAEFSVENPLVQILKAVIAPGHGIASGRSSESPYPAGSIELQIPFFKERGLDLSNCFKGTLNLSIVPSIFELYAPAYRMIGVNWTSVIPPENFALTPCQIYCKGKLYDSWVYYPEPETKVVHFQSPSMIEVIAPAIDGLKTGDEVELRILTSQIQIIETDTAAQCS